MSFTMFQDALKKYDFDYLDSIAGTVLYRNGLFTAAAMNEPKSIAYFLSTGQDVNQRESEVGNTYVLG